MSRHLISIYCCPIKKYRVFLDSSDKDVMKKIHEFSRSDDLEKFKLVLYAVRDEIANRTQFNREGDCSLGVIYAIKVGQHRFYSIYTNNPMDNYRELYVCKYEKKQTQKNNNTINETLKAIKKLEFNKLFEDGE